MREILLAEDEEHIAKLIAFKLGREGFRVTVARDGEEAVAQLFERPWSLVILDVMMPKRDGWQVLEALRAVPALAQVPVLMLTARGDAQAVASATELGATHFMKKPFEPGELAATARKLMENSS